MMLLSRVRCSRFSFKAIRFPTLIATPLMSFHQSSHLRCEFRKSDPPTTPFESNETPLYDANPAAPTAPFDSVVPPAVETIESVAEELAQAPLSDAPEEPVASIDFGADSTTELIPPVAEVAPAQAKTPVGKKKPVVQHSRETNAVKKPVVKQTAQKKAVAKKTVKKAPVKKAVPRRSVQKTAATKKAAVKKPVVKRPLQKKTVAKKTLAPKKPVAKPLKRSPPAKRAQASTIAKKHLTGFIRSALRSVSRRKVKK